MRNYFTKDGDEGSTVVQLGQPAPLFTIRPDGTMERGAGFTTNDEMSLEFWKAVGGNNPYRALLGEAVEIIQWMSGSADFGTGGQAHEGWVKNRERLAVMMKALGL